MGYYSQIILLFVLSLSVVTTDLVQDTADAVQEKVDDVKDLVSNEDSGSNDDKPVNQVKVPKLGAQNDDDNEVFAANSYSTRCQMCTETREDNGQTHTYDDYKLKPVSFCEEHECESRYDWCLVTYYEHRQARTSNYDEIRRYTCGTKDMRDSQSICKDIENKANAVDAMKVQKCRVMRSSSITFSYSSLVISLTLLLVLLINN